MAPRIGLGVGAEPHAEQLRHHPFIAHGQGVAKMGHPRLKIPPVFLNRSPSSVGTTKGTADPTNIAIIG